MQDKQPDTFVVEVLNINLIKFITLFSRKNKEDKIDGALRLSTRKNFFMFRRSFHTSTCKFANNYG